MARETPDQQHLNEQKNEILYWSFHHHNTDPLKGKGEKAGREQRSILRGREQTDHASEPDKHWFGTNLGGDHGR